MKKDKELVYELKCGSDWLNGYAETMLLATADDVDAVEFESDAEYMRELAKVLQRAVEALEAPEKAFYNLLALAANAARTGDTERVKEAVCQWVAAGKITIRSEEAEELKTTGIRFRVEDT